MNIIAPGIELKFVKSHASKKELDLLKKIEGGEREFMLMGSHYFCDNVVTQPVTLHSPAIQTHFITISAVRTIKK